MKKPTKPNRCTECSKMLRADNKAKLCGYHYRKKLVTEGYYKNKIKKQLILTSLLISLTKVDVDILQAATQPNIPPESSLIKLCGDIIIKAYKEVRK